MAGLQGRSFGGYQLVAQIGSGGIAEVYRARPAQPGEREVAIKIIYPEFARQPGFEARYQSAVQHASKLTNHPHVLPLLAHGEEDGFFYLASPYVAEGSLRDWMHRGGKLGLADVSPFYRQLCNALTYAHSLGVTHGNLKPNNIFLFEGRHVLLGDFGLLWDIAHLDMRQPGSGTEAVEYFAPEAFSGQSSQQSDIYSLGAVLFATLTGRSPFRGATPADVHAAHTQHPVPYLHQIDPSFAATGQALDAVLQRALAKRPEERFPSATLVAQAIETSVQHAASAQPLQPPNAWANPGAPQDGSNGFGGGFGGAPPANPYPNPASQFGGIGGFPAPGGQGGYAQDFGMVAPPMGGASQMGGVLQPLNFPPLPSAEADGLMEQGHIAASWNDASAQRTVRVAAPVAPPPQNGYYPSQDPGAYFPQPSGAMPPGMPPSAPMQQPAGMPPGMIAPGMAPQGMMPPGMEFAIPNEAPPAPLSTYPSSGPLQPEAPREDKGYSATELGLPRLTYADLGNGLSPEIEAQLRAELGAESERLPAASGETGEHTDMREWDESSLYTAQRGGARIQYREPAGESAEWSAAYPAPESQWDYSEALSAQQPAPREARRARSDRGDQRDAPRRSSRPADYTDERPQSGGRSRRRSTRRVDDYDDSRFDQPAPRNTHRPPRESSVRWLRPALLSVLLVAVLGLALGVVARPDLCPISTCQSLSNKAHQYVPLLDALGGSPAASVAAAPTAIRMAATSAAPATTQLTLLSQGASAVNWQASADLAWLTLAPTTGAIPPGGSAPLTITAKPTGVTPGPYTTTVIIQTGKSTVRVPVTVMVSLGPQLSASPTSLAFTLCNSPQNIVVKNTGDAPLKLTAQAQDSAAITLSATTLSLDPAISDFIKVSIKCTAKVSPDYLITLTSDGGNAQVAVKYS